MATSDQYKFPRGGLMSLGRRSATRQVRSSASTDVLTPDVKEFGFERFTDLHLEALAQRLLDARWPRGTLNIFGLEGLLTALLVLPLGLRSGTWLPLVWNESGWRIPFAIQGVESFHQFIESIVGFMRAIDKGLLAAPPRLASTLNVPGVHHCPETPDARQDWARGFCLVVSQSDNFKLRPDSITYDALFAIAMHANPSSDNLRHGRRPAPSLERAVMTLGLTRKTRGPLGPFEA